MLQLRHEWLLTVGGLAFGRGNAKARTGNKLSNSRKTFCEHTPRMTPNRLLAAGFFPIIFLEVLLSKIFLWGHILVYLCSKEVIITQNQVVQILC